MRQSRQIRGQAGCPCSPPEGVGGHSLGSRLMQERDELTDGRGTDGGAAPAGAVATPLGPGGGQGPDGAAGARPGGPAGPEQPAYPTGARARWILGVCCVAQFMVILDLSIVNVALPSIQSSLNFSSADLQWVVDAYAITFASFLMLGGRVADRLGQRRVFVFALILFGLASLAGGARSEERRVGKEGGCRRWRTPGKKRSRADASCEI